MKGNTEEEEIKQNTIQQIIIREWEFFQNVHNTGGRASCQDNYEEFNIMRSSQWEIFSLPILRSYLDDLVLAKHRNRNPVMEKYAYMMKYSVPKEYEEIENLLPVISERKREITEKIIKIYLKWEAETIMKYPAITDKGRKLHSESDTPEYTSIETYLRGELFSYSEKTLQLYYDYVKNCKNENKNLAEMNLENIVRHKGYKSLEEAEKRNISGSDDS